MKKLSIITVCLNEADKIGKTIQSVAGQSFKDYEYIIIDGASTDGTPDVIKQYESAYDKLVSEPDGGIYQAMNKAADMAKGEYLFFLNAGDYYSEPDILEKVFSADYSSDILYGDSIIDLKVLGQVLRKSPGVIDKRYMFFNTIPHQGAFIKKSFFEKNLKYDESYKIAADYDFFLRALYKTTCSTVYLGFPLTVYDYTGISSRPENSSMCSGERLIAQKKYYSEEEMISFGKQELSYKLFVKYPGLIKSVISSSPHNFVRNVRFDKDRMTRIDSIRVVNFLIFLSSFIITEIGRKIYRPYIYSNDINDFGLADTVGNFFGTITQIYFSLTILNPDYKNGKWIFPFITVGYIVYELAQYFLPGTNTCDPKDIIATIISGILSYLIYVMIEKLRIKK
jgi:glycosyltransferase involved in cell wall biosynthesis